MSITIPPIRPARRLARIAAVGLAVAAVAGCSSSSDAKGRTTTEVGSSGTTSSSSAPAGSSTSATPAAPPCTVDAATAALPTGTRAIGIVCVAGWASGPDSNGVVDAAYLLQANGSTWQRLSPEQIEQACAADNPMGIPSGVLAQSPCEVS